MPTRKAPKTGRPSIFRGKDRTGGVHAYFTREGAKALERRRVELAKLTNHDPKSVSDADVLEFAVRGVEDTVKYLRAITTEH